MKLNPQDVRDIMTELHDDDFNLVQEKQGLYEPADENAYSDPQDRIAPQSSHPQDLI